MYELNGKEWSVDQIQAAADRNNKSYDQVFDELTKAGMTKKASYSLEPVTEGIFVKPQAAPIELKSKAQQEAEAREIKAKRIGTLTNIGLPLDAAVALEPIVPVTGGLMSFIPATAGGLIEAVDNYGWKPIVAVATGKTVTEVEKLGYDIPGEELIKIGRNLQSMNSAFYDEKGQQEELIDLINKGEIKKAGIMAAEQLSGSVGSIALTYAMPLAGSAILGASVAGEELDKQLKERVDQDISDLSLIHI